MPTMPRPERQRTWERRDSVRRTTAQRGYGGRWQRARLIYLKRHPLCVMCLPSRVVPAVEIDHIRPHSGDPALMWDQENWQPLCKPCHSRKTAAETGVAAILPRFITRLRKPLTVVCGPPAAGKSTHVATHKGQLDLVLDLDELAVTAGFNTSRQGQRSKGEIAVLIRKRNDLLCAFADGRTSHPRGWLIATAGSYKQRKFWHDLGADVIIVDPGKAECRRRVLLEPGEGSRAARLSAIDAWH